MCSDSFKPFPVDGRKMHCRVGFEQILVFVKEVHCVRKCKIRRAVGSTEPKFVVFVVNLYRCDRVSVFKVVRFEDRNGRLSRCTYCAVSGGKTFLWLPVVLLGQGSCRSCCNRLASGVKAASARLPRFFDRVGPPRGGCSMGIGSDSQPLTLPLNR